MTEEKSGFTAELIVDGKNVGLNPYVTSVFVQVIQGLVRTLKNVPESSDIEVRIFTKP
jgi:hypothetical protein